MSKKLEEKKFLNKEGEENQINHTFPK